MQTDETQKIYLKVDNTENGEDEIDLLNVASNIGKKKNLYKYLLIFAVFAGLLVGLIIMGVQGLTGSNARSRAVISFQYDGIEEGLDPNGASFDINKLKAPVVIQAALDELGITDEISVEDVRQNISIEGVIPTDAVERITAMNEAASKDVSYYEKILDVSYYPSQYIVYLQKLHGMSGSRTSEVLNAVLAAYKDWFLKTYANTTVLTVTGNLVNYQDYDYTEAVDLISSQIDIMEDYVTERDTEAPDFRSANTGLSFSDIETSLSTLKKIDLANLQSYVESNNLTKDKDKLVEYYNYNIQQYNLELSTLRTQLSDVQSSIDSYQKDPVVVVSNQDSVQQIEQTNEYYDTLVAQKLDLSSQIAEITTKITKTNALLAKLNEGDVVGEAARADEMLSSIVETLKKWSDLIEQTADEYYDTALFSNAYKISVPAQYQSLNGGLMGVCKTFGICIGAALLVVIFVWCVDGFVTEMKNSHKKTSVDAANTSSIS